MRIPSVALTALIATLAMAPATVNASDVATATVAAGHGAVVAGSRLPDRAINRASVPSRNHGYARWGERYNGRWVGGWHAPGGWNAYRRPVRGYALPYYWMQPSFFISVPGYYGLPAPRAGYGWSRYYDDAVLTDRAGRVVEYRQNTDWDRYDYEEDRYDRYDRYEEDRYGAARPERRSSRAAGAVIGGAIGGAAGNMIAGRGNKTVGTIVGAGLGAVTGSAIAGAADRKAERRQSESYRYDRRDDRYDDGYAVTDDAAPHWAGDDRYEDVPPAPVRKSKRDKRYSQAESGPYLPYEPVPMQGGYVGYAGGYAGGYLYPAPVVTTIVMQPMTTTTTTVTEEISYRTIVAKRPAAKRVVRKAKPKPRCTC